jgi:peptide chain release factor 1
MGLSIEKLDAVEKRYAEVERLLCEPTVISDQATFRRLAKERSELEELVGIVREHRGMLKQIADNRSLVSDPELGEMAAAELPDQLARLEKFEQQMTRLLLPPDPNDARNTILEIRSGTGGEEAALFAGDLFRMYSRFAERKGWSVEVMSLSESGTGGLKEVICLVGGKLVYSSLKFEGGVHRVQRVPATESQGRIHTSTATVAVLPEAEEIEVKIEDKDIRIDVQAAGGPGGQGVNTTNSAVRITHLPTNLVVYCQDERSQIKNRARAMKILRARLLERQQQAQHDAIAAERKGMVGAGERSEKVRTYNFPQNRFTDHRIGLTIHSLDRIVDGDLDEVVTALRTHHEQERLQAEQEKLA